MSKHHSTEVAKTARRVRKMYNAHPFPSRRSTPSNKSDDRYRRIFTDFLHIPIDQFRQVNFIDAGCGTGDVTWVWRRLLHPSNRVFALDLSEASVRIARQANDDSIESEPLFTVGSLLELGIPDHSMDFVHCSGVLVAVPDPQRAFEELARILKPGGYMVLVLYHKYGRALHGWRRAIVDLIEQDDIDQRAKLGGKLFGRRMRKWAREENVPYEGMLYDQFGLPCESRYSIGDALRWFTQANIEYIGTWPPIEWSQLGNGLRFARVFAPTKKRWLSKILFKVFSETSAVPARPPGLVTRMTMQSLWGINQQQLFSIAGRKKSIG